MCKTVKRQVGLFHRQFHQAPPELRLKVFNTTILPKLEYCSAVWDPHLKKDIASLDSIQRFAGRIITRNWCMTSSELQSTLNWQPLRTRRKNIKLNVVYNIVNNLSRIPPTLFVKHPSSSLKHSHNEILRNPLPSSPVGKISELHAEGQQFKSHLGHKFFYTHTHFFCTRTYIHMHAHTYVYV